jgi:ssDNA-binding Zn-finger/Zn-ribbon topoisomerase 1
MSHDDQVIKSVREIVERLINQVDKPEEIQLCPNCGGELHIRFQGYGNKLGVQIWCEDCYVRMALDYINTMPVWNL